MSSVELSILDGIGWQATHKSPVSNSTSMLSHAVVSKALDWK